MFNEQWVPKVQLDVNTTKNKLNDELYEVVLRVTLTASMHDKPAILIEVDQAGLFQFKAMKEDQVSVLVNTVCPEMLYPYAREVVDSLATKASFPAFALAPMNFEALFRQALQRQAQDKAQSEAAKETNH